MKYVMLYETAPGGLKKVPTNLPGHQARLREFHAQGKLLMAGPFTDAGDGAMGVFTSREAVEEFIRDDPFILNGVVGKWAIREWNEVLA